MKQVPMSVLRIIGLVLFLGFIAWMVYTDPMAFLHI